MTALSFVKASGCADGACVEVAFKRASDCSDAACVEVAFRSASDCQSGACVEVGMSDAGCGTGTCVEVGFVRASSCTNGACVEAHISEEQIFVRDSKQNGQGEQPVLSFTRAEWDAFIAGVKRGEFD